MIFPNVIWKEVHEDGRRKARCAGNGSVKGWKRKRERDDWLRGNSLPK